MNYRILFLDIDGVLHSYPPHSGLQSMCWVPHLAKLVLPHPDVRVVIHSGWRYDYSVELLRELLGELGPRLVGVTPRGQRYESIKDYLLTLQIPGSGALDYRILDDTAEEFPRNPAPRELILCDGRTGVSARRTSTALREWLNSSRPSNTVVDRVTKQRARSSLAMALRQGRVLSIDYDGVLHPTGDGIRASDPMVHVGLFGWLPALVDVLRPHPDVRLLVHSSWRYSHDNDELREMLGELGSRFVGATPRGPRMESISWWLSQNPSFKSYRILDDEKAEFPSPLPPELVLCDPSSGVASPAVLAAIRQWLEE